MFLWPWPAESKRLICCRLVGCPRERRLLTWIVLTLRIVLTLIGEGLGGVRPEILTFASLPSKASSVEDYLTQQGAYGPHPPATVDARSDLSERRAGQYQLGLYVRLTGMDPNRPDANYLHVKRDLDAKHPHRPPK